MTTTFIAWRHPRPIGHEGRCIGHTDLRVDPRKARRLARRIHAQALKLGSPRVVCTSALTRCRMVGRCLRRLGWQHLTDSALLESSFGRWDGRAWSSIPREEVDAWVADFLHHAPGGGERLSELLRRVAAWQPPVAGACVVGHAGWMLARRWLQDHGLEHPPRHAEHWPAPPAYNEAWCFGSVLA